MENYFLPVKLLKDMAIVNPPPVQTIVCWHGTWNVDPTKILNMVGWPGFFFVPVWPHLLWASLSTYSKGTSTSTPQYLLTELCWTEYRSTFVFTLLFDTVHSVFVCTFPWTVSQIALSFISQHCTKLNLKNKNRVELIKPTVCCSGLFCCTATNLLLLLFIYLNFVKSLSSLNYRFCMC